MVALELLLASIQLKRLVTCITQLGLSVFHLFTSHNLSKISSTATVSFVLQKATL